MLAHVFIIVYTINETVSKHVLNYLPLNKSLYNNHKYLKNRRRGVSTLYTLKHYTNFADG